MSKSPVDVFDFTLSNIVCFGQILITRHHNSLQTDLETTDWFSVSCKTASNWAKPFLTGFRRMGWSE